MHPETTTTADVGLFGPDSVTWRIHSDPAMALAGFRSLLLQAVHPLVMAGFDDHSFFRSDPWGRLQRTGAWVGTVTYGTTAEAETAGRRLRRLHASLAPGVEPESGQSYRVDDPDLLMWVHVTEAESFLSTYRRSGGWLRRGEGDRYIDEMRASAALVGLDPATVPASEADVRDYYRSVRPQLRVTRVARRNVAWGFAPPMPRWVTLATPARPAWASLVAVAAAMLPRWTRRLYGLPGLPTTDLGASMAGRVVRQSALLLPDRFIANPAHQEAKDRLAAA
ncbi:MAG TPA: oxygenase MpaB family protein [Propionibacteriaceae bacterium]